MLSMKGVVEGAMMGKRVNEDHAQHTSSRRPAVALIA